MAARVTAGALLAGCVPHVLVLTGRIPHTALAGGRVADERRGKTMSAISIPLLAGEACAVLWAGDRAERARPMGSALGVHAAVTLVLQSAGTELERRFLAPVCGLWLTGAVALAVAQF